MVSRRRAIHQKQDAGEEEEGENNQVLQNCHKCNKPIPINDKIECDQFAKIPESNNPRRGNKDLNPDVNQVLLICQDCDVTINIQYGFLSYGFVAIVALALIAIIAISITFKYQHAEQTFDVKVKNQTQDEIDFDDELYALEDYYTQQEERVWYTFASGVKSVIAEEPNKPSVFLLLYDNDNTESTIKCLVQDVTRAATKYLMKKEIKPLMVAGADLNQKDLMNDPGKLLVKYKDKVVRNGAMIVTNLENINPKIAASFHFFCDRYTPLVEKAIYFFTVKLKQAPNVALQKVSLQKVAEETLHKLWEKDLPDNLLHPLITRMTGNVLRISSDSVSC